MPQVLVINDDTLCAPALEGSVATVIPAHSEMDAISRLCLLPPIDVVLFYPSKALDEAAVARVSAFAHRVVPGVKLLHVGPHGELVE